jgi:16S rRNA G527 N7-methylase RsmG
MIIKPDFLPVENEPGLVRDTASNAIIATSLSQKRAFIERQKRELNISKIETMNHRIENLETNVTEIKDMLQKVINILDK